MSYRYRVDVNELHTSFTKFESRFSLLSSIKEGDKIGYTKDKVLYLDTSSYFQSISRWYYNQSRETTFDVFEEQINEFVLFLRYLTNIEPYHLSNNTDTEKFSDLVKATNKISVTLVNALFFLAKTYKNDKSIVSRLNRLKSDVDYRNSEVGNFI